MRDIPRLTTARLRLRAFTRDDVQPWAAICADAEVMRHIGAGGPVSADVAWRHLALHLGQWALKGHGVWALERRDDGRLIGSTGFLDPPGWPGCELSWLLARDAWGQGLAQEASAVALAFGRDELGLKDVISMIRPDNQRSIRLAERLHAVNEGPIDFLGASALRFRHPS